MGSISLITFGSGAHLPPNAVPERADVSHTASGWKPTWGLLASSRISVWAETMSPPKSHWSHCRMTVSAIRFEHVSRHFGDVKAVDDANLEIGDGEFFSMLGPSGSGKTTCLRMIAGFDRPTRGNIFLYGQDVSDLPPYERNVNTVFQDYALFPHMDVGDNIAYGLMIKGVSKPERIKRVDEMLD